MTLDLTLDGLPPMNTADRTHHWSAYRLKRAWEGKVCAAVLHELGRWPERPLDRARVTITRCSTREPDFENLAQGGKFLLDGLVKAGVIADDSPKVIGRPTYLWERAPRGGGCVRINVRPVGGVEIGPRVPAA